MRQQYYIVSYAVTRDDGTPARAYYMLQAVDAPDALRQAMAKLATSDSGGYSPRKWGDLLVEIVRDHGPGCSRMFANEATHVAGARHISDMIEAQRRPTSRPGPGL
jgi:hypothetical protein